MYEILNDFQVLAAGMLAVFAAGIGFAGVWHRLDLKLEKAKAEMQSAYLALKMSVDLTLAGQGEYRAKVIEGVQELWNAILAVQEGRDHLLKDKKDTSDDILLARYRDRGQQAVSIGQIRESVSPKHIVFVGDNLWARFSGILTFYSALEMLDEQTDWRTNELIISILRLHFFLEAKNDAENENVASEIVVDVANGVASERVETVKKKGLWFAVVSLETAFLREASRVMTGSREFADSLS
jgi:hypothetical protein